MAPLTRPELINPLVASFLGASKTTGNERVGESRNTLEAIPLG